MTNGEKFKTAKERTNAFEVYCHGKNECKNYRKKCHKVLCVFEWLDLEAEEDGEIKVGDTVAYRSCDDNQPEWVAFTVRRIENGYLYEYEDLSGENIAVACAHKVSVRR